MAIAKVRLLRHKSFLIRHSEGAKSNSKKASMASGKDSGTAINLRSFNIGRRSIRYMVINTKQKNQERDKLFRIPLFLGADVLSSCRNSDIKNLGRIHSKYAEDGLACKVHLPNGYQIKGIRGLADKAWFYSIHGLFRVAFSFYPRNELMVMIRTMLNLWMERIEEPLLQKTLLIEDINDVFFDDIISEETFVCAKQGEDVNLECQHAENSRTTIENFPPEREIQVTSGLEQYNHTESRYKLLDYQMTPEQSKSDISSSGCTAAQGNGDCGNSIAKIMDDIKPRLMNVYKDEPSCSLIVPYIESFADLLIDEESNVIEKQSTSFPIKLIKDYMDAKCNKMTEGPQDHELAIHIISSWIGDRFYLFKDIIKHNIDAFKQTYINSITELPSPEEIVRTVYPSAMYSLVYLWIRGTGEDEQHDVEGAKKIRSICLLILELLNGSPITGLGHWIFSII